MKRNQRWWLSALVLVSLALPGTAQNQPLPSSVPLPLNAHVQRFVDSTVTSDWQCCPTRTYRARQRRAAYASENNRVYMILGSSMFAYDASAFFNGGQAMTTLGGRPSGGEQYLRGSAVFNA